MKPAYLEGTAKTNSNPAELIAAGTEIRATVECGRHLADSSFFAAKRASMAALAYRWPAVFANIELPEEQELKITAEPEFIYGPASPNIGQNPPQNRDWLIPPKSEDESYGRIYLITGNELTGGEITAQKPAHLKYLPDEIWAMIANPKESQKPDNRNIPPVKPSKIADALKAVKADWLNNGEIVEEGSAFAFTVILDKDGKQARLELLYIPIGGVATMFPANPEIEDQGPEIGEVLQLKAQKTVSCSIEKTARISRQTGSASINM